MQHSSSLGSSSREIHVTAKEELQNNSQNDATWDSEDRRVDSEDFLFPPTVSREFQENVSRHVHPIRIMHVVDIAISDVGYVAPTVTRWHWQNSGLQYRPSKEDSRS